MTPARNHGRTLVLTGVVLLVVWLLNPPREEHLAKLGTVGSPQMPTSEERAKGITNTISPVDLDYHNYILFSTVSRVDGGVASFGIFHTVFDLR